MRDKISMDKIEGFVVWKYNAGLLYDYASVNKLKTPSLSFEWLTKTYKEGNVERQFCLLGSSYSERERHKNMLKICSLPMPPRKPLSSNPSDYVFKERGDHYEGFGIPGLDDTSQYGVKNEYIYPHKAGAASSIRVRPTNDQNLVATSASDSRIRLFMLWPDGTNPSGDQKYIKSHTTIDVESNEISWLQWNRWNSDSILSCGMETHCLVTNVQAKTSTKFEASQSVNSAIWLSPESLCTVDEAGFVKVFDMRTATKIPEISIFTGIGKDADEMPINAVDMHPTFNSILATGGASTMVELVDLRSNQSKVVHSLSGHENRIQEIYFHLEIPNSIVSTDNFDGTFIWNLSNIGVEQSYEEKADGVPELVFKHSGHCGDIFDIRWNPLGPSIGYTHWLGSTAKDYTIQSYIPRDTVMDITNIGFKDTLNKIENYEDYMDLWEQVAS